MGLALAQDLGDAARHLVWCVTAVVCHCGSRVSRSLSERLSHHEVSIPGTSARGNSPSSELTDSDLRSVALGASAIAARGGAPG